MPPPAPTTPPPTRPRIIACQFEDGIRYLSKVHIAGGRMDTDWDTVLKNAIQFGGGPMADYVTALARIPHPDSRLIPYPTDIGQGSVSSSVPV